MMKVGPHAVHNPIRRIAFSSLPLESVAMDHFPHVLLHALLLPAAFCNSLLPTNKLSLATWGSYYQQDHMGPGTYAFGYDIEDPATGNIQFKQEERHPNGTVTGNYGYVDAEGRPHVVTYISDENGYRTKIETEGEAVKYYPDKTSYYGVLLNEMEGAGGNGYFIENENELDDPDRRRTVTAIPKKSFYQPLPIIQYLTHPSYLKSSRVVAMTP